MANEPTLEQMNEAIAEFMGVCKMPNGYYKIEGRDYAYSVKYYPSHLHYHTSWDWLMPVVEKINQIWVNSVRSKQIQIEETYRAMQNRISLCSIVETVEHVYQFITWFNQQKQKDGTT